MVEGKNHDGWSRRRCGTFNQAGTKERTGLKIERTMRLFARDAFDLCLPLLFRNRRQVADRQRKRDVGCDDLHRLPIPERKRGAQRLMPTEEAENTLFQHRCIDAPLQPYGQQAMVGVGVFRMVAAVEPDPFLNEGERRGGRRSSCWESLAIDCDRRQRPPGVLPVARFFPRRGLCSLRRITVAILPSSPASGAVTSGGRF